MLIIGIDPGISGSICFLKEGKIIELLKEYKFDDKIKEFKNRFYDYRNIVINEVNTLLNK